MCGLTSLSPDEAYYRVWSTALQAGYLDHPPAVALLIRLGTALGGDDALGVRLFGPVLTLAGSILLVRAGRDLLGFGPERAWLAALLFNATLMVGVGAVTMTPDTPVVFFWGATLWTLGRLLRTRRSAWLVAAGASVGAGFCSKYTAVLLAPAVAVWLVATPETRRLLRTPAFAAAIVAGLALSAPVVAWNAAHGWASFGKQGGREAVLHAARAPRFLSELLFGQVGLLTPLVAVLALRGSARLARAAARGEAGPLLVTLATAVPAAVFVLHAVGDRVQANWPCVLYPSLALAAAAGGTDGSGAWRRLLRPVPAASFGLLVTALVYLQAVLRPFDLPAKLDVTASRLAGWPGLAASVRALDAPLGLPVASPEYGLAAELAWDGAGARVGGVDDRRWTLIRLPPMAAPSGLVLVVHRVGRDEGRWRWSRPIAVVSRRAGSRVIERDAVDLAAPLAEPIPMSAVLPVRAGRVQERH